MKKLVAIVLCVIVLCTAFPAKAESSSAKAYAVIEQTTGEVITAQNETEQLPIAGLAKLMAYLVIYETIGDGDNSDIVRVSQYAASKSGTRVFLDAGSEYTLEALLKPATMCSANDAITAIGEHLFGSEEAFTARMNGRASELKLDAVFADCTGLSDETHASADDLAKIAAELAKHTQFFKYSGIWLDTFIHQSGRETEMTNANTLIKSEGFDGMATGSSDKAGYCLAASYKKGTARYICIVLGDNSKGRFELAKREIGNAAAAYSVKQIAEKNTRVKTMDIENGTPQKLDIVAKESLTLLLKSGEQTETQIVIAEELLPPIAKGSKVGELIVKCGGEVRGKTDLVAANSIDHVTFGTSIKKVMNIWINGC